MAKPIGKILLATDGSEGSIKAAKFASKIAGPSHAIITILTVHDEESVILSEVLPIAWPAIAPTAGVEIDAIKRRIESEAETSIIAETRKALGDLPKIEVVQLWGHATDAICNYARDNEVDMMVVGSRGRSAISRLLLGSISNQLAHHSPCPITLVP